ncbi:hypothetical protein SUGI_0788330 [Cryptomeria japonica]|nr:hypothetical protein SUGI_0788330 [Cryptomeria japonica]
MSSESPDGLDVPKGVLEREGSEIENGVDEETPSVWQKTQNWVGVFGVEGSDGEAREGLSDGERHVLQVYGCLWFLGFVRDPLYVGVFCFKLICIGRA